MSKHIDPQLGLAYLEGHLDGAQRAKLERHLANCPVCQNQLAEHQTVRHLLQKAGQTNAQESVEVPNWYDLRPQAKEQNIWGKILQNGTQLALASAAILFLFVFVWQLQPTEIIFEPVAAGPATATPTPTPLKTAVPLPTTQFIPNILPTMPEPTPTAHPTMPNATPAQDHHATQFGQEVSAVHLNNTGMAAFVLDETLYIETAVHSGQFTPITNHVASDQLAWSADGQELLFFTQPIDGERPYIMHWNATTQELTPFSELINRTLPNVPFTSVHWAENGRELLLTTTEKLAPNSEWDSGVWLANLEDGTLTLVVEAVRLIDAHWLDMNSFMMSLNCGEQCEIVMAYDREQNLLWKAYADRPEFEATSGLYIVQPSAQRIIHLNTYNNPQTVDLINTVSGEITPIFTLPKELQFAANTLVFSPKDQLLIFETINGNGEIHIQQLQLDSATMRPFAIQDKGLTFIDGAWSPDGKFFIYNVFDSTIEASYVYLWQAEDEAAKLIHAAATNLNFQDFVWTSDQNLIYFNQANEALWRYDVSSGELIQVAGQ